MTAAPVLDYSAEREVMVLGLALSLIHARANPEEYRTVSSRIYRHIDELDDPDKAATITDLIGALSRFAMVLACGQQLPPETCVQLAYATMCTVAIDHEPA